MGMVKKSITVTEQQADWIQSRMESGQFASDSEVLRDLIRKEQTRDAEIEVIREALIKAEAGGFTDRSPTDIVKAVVERKIRDGDLPA